jgi:hypothetical protein
MSAPRRSLCTAAIIACVTLGSVTNFALAGPIAAGSVPGGPPVLGSLTQGSPVDDASLITTQYTSAGLNSSVFSNLSLAALGSINGTTAFVPASAQNKGYNLDFASFVGFQVVNPTTGTFSTTNHLSVEFIGPVSSSGVLIAMSPEGGMLGSTEANDGIGPHGGHLATLDMNGIGLFAAWSLPDVAQTNVVANPIWGLAFIDIVGSVNPPPPGDTERTPEPATLALACGGLFSALGAAWKRRRSARN